MFNSKNNINIKTTIESSIQKREFNCIYRQQSQFYFCMQLAIKQACNSRATLHMHTQHQQPLDVQALVAFAKSISTASKHQIEDFYRQMGQPHEKALLQQFVHSSPQHPQIKTVILILAKAYEIGNATYAILQERVRIMLNWSIDIEAKQVLHQGFVHVITLNDAHRERVDLLLGEMGQIIVQIASDPAKEDYQSSPVDLGESAIILNVRHPDNFPSLASTYIKLLFWRFRATGFIIEPYEMETIACYAPFIALIRLVISEDGLSLCPSVIEQIFSTFNDAFEVGLGFKCENSQYIMFLRHIFQTWSSMNSSFELIYQAGCRPLSSGAFNYLQEDQHLQLKIQTALFHLLMLEKEQKMKTSFPLVDQLPAMVPSILVTLASLLEESSEDWEERAEFVKMLLGLLEVDIGHHPQGLKESMEIIRLTVLPLIRWGVHLAQDEMEDGLSFTNLLDEFCASDSPSLKLSAFQLLNAILQSNPDTTTILFDWIASSLEDYFNDSQPNLSFKQVAIILTMIYNQHTHEELITDILGRYLEKGSIILDKVNPEDLYYFFYLLESIIHLFEMPTLSPFIEFAITEAPKDISLQFTCLKFLQKVFENAAECQPYLELILSHLAFFRAEDSVQLKWELLSHISKYLSKLKDNQLDLLVQFVREGVYREMEKLEESAIRGKKMYRNEFKQYFTMCKRIISYQNSSFHPDRLCKIITLVKDVLPAAAKLKLYPIVTKLLLPIFKNTHQNQQVLTLIQSIIGILLDLLQERSFIPTELLAPVYQYLTQFENLHSQKALEGIYVAFNNSLLSLVSHPRTDQSFLFSLKNILLLQHCYLDKLGQNMTPSILEDLSTTNYQLKEIVETYHSSSCLQTNLLGQFKLVELLLKQLQGQEINYLTLLLPISQQQFSLYSSIQLVNFLQKQHPVPHIANIMECCFCLFANQRKDDGQKKKIMKTSFQDILILSIPHSSTKVPEMISQLFARWKNLEKDLYEQTLNSFDPNKVSSFWLCLENTGSKKEQEKKRQAFVSMFYSPQIVWKKVADETRTIRKVLGDKQGPIDIPTAMNAKRDHSVETNLPFESANGEPEQLFKVRIDNCLHHERMVAEQPSEHEHPNSTTPVFK